MPNIIIATEDLEVDAIEFAKIFEISPNIKDGIIESLSGTILLKPSITQKYRIVAQDAYGERPLRWGLPSPKMSAKSPDNPHAAQARFTANNLKIENNRPIKIYLEDDKRKRELVFNVQLKISNNNDFGNFNSIKDRINALITEKNRTQEQYTTLREDIDSIDKYNRNVSWFEMSVLLNALFKEKPGITFNQLAKIKRIYAENTSGWQHFIDYLHKSIYPLSITEHGYVMPLSYRDEKKVWSDIEKLHSVFDKIGFECFINSGTLLGAIREGTLIAHDDDVDLAVILKCTTFSEAAREWINLKSKLANMGILNKTFSKNTLSHCKIGEAGGASVDLFPAWIMDDRVYIWPHTYGEIYTQDLLPLKTITLNEKTVKIPQSPEKILRINYGANWTTPDSSFKFNWTAALKKFDQFLNSLKLLERGTQK